MNFAFFRSDMAPPVNRNIGIIGAGPSGLAAAGYLVSNGYHVEVYDKLPKPGGLMVFGIPGSRIPRERVLRGAGMLERTYGVIFHTRTKICCSVPLHEEEGDHFSFDMVGLGELLDRHDAIMICTGSWKSRKLGIPGEDLAGVYSGLEFLFPIRAIRYAAPNVSVPDVKGRRVAVIGAGHSAVDVAHSAKNLGAAEVKVIYRRTAAEAPCGRFAVSRMGEAGCEWLEKRTPLRFVGETRVEGVEVKTAEGDVVVIPADAVVTAIGEIPTPPFAKELGLENMRKGDVRWLNMTAMDNVFVAGDVLTGPSKIGHAVYSGLRAARSLGNWLDLKDQNRESEYDGEADVMPKRKK
ncbi:MAG: FAD-dependent oxidoreductase [Desulfovibrio sp.]|jgi:glutamate synthase (NADPH/NADH) small chain|nr:FAD-dependent oxidoreductase [Desulfovibrio sp.]